MKATLKILVLALALGGTAINANAGDHKRFVYNSKGQLIAVVQAPKQQAKVNIAKTSSGRESCCTKKSS